MKLQLEALTHLSRDAMHVHASVMIFLIACLVLKTRPSDWRPWLVVLAVQLTNEALDMVAMIADDGRVYLWPCIEDTINTMILPTLLVLFARWTPIFDAPAKAGALEPKVCEPNDEPPA